MSNLIPHRAAAATPPGMHGGRIGSPWPAAVLLLLSMLIAGMADVLAAEIAVSGETAGPTVTGGGGRRESQTDDEEPRKIVDAIHGGISSAVERSARRVDSFFADDRFYTDATETYLRVSGQTTWEKGEEDKAEARLRARIDLPGTRERLRLFAEGGDPDDVEGEGSDSVAEALDDNDYNIGLEAQIEGTRVWDIRPAIGAKATGSVDPFVRLRAIRYAPLRRWLMRFATGISEFVDDGTELGARLDFDRKIHTDLLFRSTSRARYRDSKDRVEALHQFSLFQKVNDRVGMGYEVGVRADDDPDWEVDHYFTQVRARFRAYKKWFFVELKPQLIFREEDDYDPSFRFSLRADVVFGARYREEQPERPQPIASTASGSAPTTR